MCFHHIYIYNYLHLKIHYPSFVRLIQQKIVTLFFSKYRFDSSKGEVASSAVNDNAPKAVLDVVVFDPILNVLTDSSRLLPLAER
uniref:Uncharacterized protein n=1 Tax=Heterorhabditis bacteriophora TaxID=37862 RepID=A0A1I7WEN0_HETBA